MSDWQVARSQYWVQYLVMNWVDMCEGIRRLKGQDLGDHLQDVLDVSRHVLQVAVSGCGIAVQYVPGVREAVRRIGECLETILSVGGVAIPAVLVLIGAVVQVASQSETGRRVGSAMQTVGRGIGAIAATIVAAIREVLADIERAIAKCDPIGSRLPPLPWRCELEY